MFQVGLSSTENRCPVTVLSLVSLAYVTPELMQRAADNRTITQARTLAILLYLLNWIACQSDSEFLEYLAVHLAEHYCRVYLASFKLR